MSASSKFFQGSRVRAQSSRFLNQVKTWMEDHPIASNSLLCFHLWIAGDCLAQYSEHPLVQQRTTKDEEDNDHPTFHSSYDFQRTAQCASYGAVVTGPLLATWYPYLDTLCKRANLTARYGLWAAPIAKVLADEFLMDPPCLVAFYGYMNICEGGNRETLEHKLKEEFWRSWFTSLAVWPVVLLGTFRYLPLYAQAPLINACCILWDGFLSHRNAVAKVKEIENKIEENVKSERATNVSLL
jgi:protein Mpv17